MPRGTGGGLGVRGVPLSLGGLDGAGGEDPGPVARGTRRCRWGFRSSPPCWPTRETECSQTAELHIRNSAPGRARASRGPRDSGEALPVVPDCEELHKH
ncbi:hypothetical protein NDU88_004333 [Pleurodeles waltl]|uniref:Uncharacterized protein n=1 Tax=Pleurodeles waltl TaxID=8319 RepID=A0AAV7WTU6_PLEWA|nr:hypothetical protein NDU88_004333 [Pleurodeles waltl]